MPAGRPRTPIAIRKLQGNPGQRPIPPEPDTEELTDKDLTPPSWVKSQIALECWWETAPVLARTRILTRTDLYVLAMLCESISSYVRKRSVSNLNAIRLYLVELGMTPAARSKVVPASKKTGDSAWDALDKLGV